MDIMPGTKPPKKIKRKPNERIDWEGIPLGEFSDGEIARRYGLKAQTVSNARRRMGIPSHRKYAIKADKIIDWDLEPRLGKMPDRVLQRVLGVRSITAIVNARNRRGIPPFDGPNKDDMYLALYEIKDVVKGDDATARAVQKILLKYKV